MTNVWESKFPEIGTIKYIGEICSESSKSSLIFLDKILHKIAKLQLGKRSMRLPINTDYINRPEGDRYFINLRLIECYFQTLKSIAKQNPTVESWVHKESGGTLQHFRLSVANSGKLHRTAIALYDKQIVLLILLNTNHAGATENRFDKFESIHLSIFDVVRFIVIRIASKVKFTMRKLRGLEETWNTGILSTSNFPPNLQLAAFSSQSEEFAADPFIFSDGKDKYVFYEYLSKGKGQIQVSKILGDGLQNLGVALCEEFHLSYPFVFENEKRFLMMPETSEAGDIRIYTASSFPFGWEHYLTLMRGVSAVDSFVTQVSENWFMFANLSSGLVDEFSTELWLFTNTDLAETGWRIHPMSPIHMEAEKARNGGYFEREGNRYRVNQVPGFSRYGFGVKINEIKTLNQDEYIEREIFDFVGGFDSNHSGNHHLSFSNGTFAFDYTSIGKKVHD